MKKRFNLIFPFVFFVFIIIPCTTVVAADNSLFGDFIDSVTVVDLSHGNRDWFELEKGDIINLDRRITLRADCHIPNEKIGKVKFRLSGSPQTVHIERVAPYAIAGDNNGDYYSWNPSKGRHSLLVSVYDTQGRYRAGKVIVFEIR